MEAIQLAQEQLPKMLSLIEPEEYEDFGFNTTDDLSAIQIGRLVQLTTAYDIQNLSETNQEALEINTVMLPLILDNTVRSFIFISKEEGAWRVVGIGSKNYAQGNDAFFNKMDDKASLIIAVPQANEEFINDMSGNMDAFYPIFHVNEEVENRAHSVTELLQIYRESNYSVTEEPTE